MPLRARGRVGRFDEQAGHDIFVESRGLQVHGLLGVVGGRVIAVGEPVLEKFFVGRAGFIEDAGDHGGNAAANETVLIAADKKIAQRFGIGNGFDAERVGDGGGAFAEIG